LARSVAQWLGVTTLTVVLAVLFLPSLSRADTRIGGELGYAAGHTQGASGVAVSAREGGDLYFIDDNRVDQFEPNGTFVRGFGFGVVPGAATGVGDLTAGSNIVTNVATASGAFSEAGEGGKLISGNGIPPGTQIVRLGGGNSDLPKGAIELSNLAELTESGVALTVAAGPGNIPTNERQQITVEATGGDYTLSFISPRPAEEVETSSELVFGAPASGSGSVQAALEALPSIGAGNVSVTGPDGGPYVVEFSGRFADTNVRRLSANNVDLTGGSAPEVIVTTPTEGGGVPETCTTICGLPSVEENSQEKGENFTGSLPGQWSFADEIAVDNSCAQHEPPLTGSTTPTCEEYDPSFGDVYVVDTNNFRVEKFGPAGEFLLMVGGGVDQGPHHPGNVCTAAYLAEGDTCGKGLPGVGPAHFYREEPGTVAGGFKDWGEGRMHSIAVGPDGTVYVGDYGRIQEFNPDGAFAGEFIPPGETTVAATGDLTEESNVITNVKTTSGAFAVGQPIRGAGIPFDTNIIGLAPGKLTLSKPAKATATGVALSVEPLFVTALALNSSGDIFERSAVPIVKQEAPVVGSEVPGVREFSPAHVLLRTFDAGAEEAGSVPDHLAVDDQGNLFVSDLNKEGARVFRAFRPDGSLYAEFSSDLVSLLVKGLAISDATGSLFAPIQSPTDSYYVAVLPLPQAGPPVVEAEQASDIEPETATLNAIVNPRELDTTYRYQWVTQQHFEAEGFANAEETAPVDLGSIWRRDPTQTAISNLAPATVYHWRVVATNSEGQVAPETTFETLPDLSVRDFTTQTVGPEEVVLKAELNNNNSLQAGRYVISVGTGESEGTIKAGSNKFEPVEATFTELQPNTEYHYHIFVENGYGHETSGDRTFTTEPSAAEAHLAEEGECPNVTLREENGSTALADCRAYEQVSPAFKAGYPVNQAQDSLAGSGERDYFSSKGAFAGSNQNRGGGYYVAHRTPGGWVTTSPIGPPAGPEYQPSVPLTFDAELNTSLFTALPASSSIRAGNQPGQGPPILYRGLSNGAFVPASPPITGSPPAQLFSFSGASFDLSHVLLSTTGFKLLESDPRPNTSVGSAPDRLYEVTDTGEGEPTLSLAAEVPPDLPPSCKLGRFGQRTDPISADGSTLFYEAPIELLPGGSCGPGTHNPYALFARVEGGPPIDVSAPFGCASCAGTQTGSPLFYGTSPHGNLAWFTIKQPLVSSDKDQGEGASAADLYLAKLENGQLTELVQASHGEPSDPSPGEGAGVQGVVRISQDGTHAAFVATGVLTTEANASTGLAAVQGADNLYLYDADTGATKFISTLCTGPEASGTGPDPACPADLDNGTANPIPRNDTRLWTDGNAGNNLSEAAITSDGRHLIFTSYGRLTNGDTDSARDIYRYDFSTGELIRLSFGRNGNDGNGNDDSFSAELPGLGERWEPFVMAEDQERSISTDGSVVVFETFAPLVSRDTNLSTVAYGGPLPGGITCKEVTGCLVNGRDVYQWEEAGNGTCHQPGGCISLVSSGLDPHNTSGAVLSSSGHDVTFITARGLVPADTDGVADVYDAREGGGFPFVPPPGLSCEEGSPEACHGQGTGEQLHPGYTSEESHTGGNGPQQLRCAPGKVRVVKHGQTRCVAKKRAKRHRSRHRHSHRRASRPDRGGQR
jgi:hypothetical protein